MSDMIDRLKAISAGAGRDIAADLADHSTIQVMAVQVRSGVRRRRIRISAVAASVAVFVGVSIVALPALLRGAPQEIEPGHAVVRTVGPVTTFDDGAMSVVLANGSFIDLPPYEGDTVYGGTPKATMCARQSPADLPPTGWRGVNSEANRLVRLVAVVVPGADGTFVSVLPGQVLATSPDGSEPSVSVAVQADPALAPYMALKVTVYQFHVDEAVAGDERYQNTFTTSKVFAQPTVTFAGDAGLGTRVGTVTTDPLTVGDWGACYVDVPPPGYWAGPFYWYIVADVFLIDREGGQTTLGTYVSWFEAPVSHMGAAK